MSKLRKRARNPSHAREYHIGLRSIQFLFRGEELDSEKDARLN